MKKSLHTTRQYEPLSAPSAFGEEMRRFVNRLTEILDDIYRRYGRLGLNDLSTAFSDALGGLRARIGSAEAGLREAGKTASAAWDAANVNSRDILALRRAPRPRAFTLTLPAAGWAEGAQTVPAADVAPDSRLIVTPHPDSYEACAASLVRCAGQSGGALAFACASPPAEDVRVNVLIL